WSTPRRSASRRASSGRLTPTVPSTGTSNPPTCCRRAPHEVPGPTSSRCPRSFTQWRLAVEVGVRLRVTPLWCPSREAIEEGNRRTYSRS
ncbi:MAG: hypothetical protein AVDCRST_MAG12-2321, partial [uncultured Rubrobacteraceae bacterium]